jgi:predicted negative regulator of RcsB-dependent stress response
METPRYGHEELVAGKKSKGQAIEHYKKLMIHAKNSCISFLKRPSPILRFAILLALPLASVQVSIAQQRNTSNRASQTPNKSITVRTEPNAVVWIDEVRRGKTDAAGTIIIKPVSAGRHSLRVRAYGFSEIVVSLSPPQRGNVTVRLVKTTDAAELLFQKAETARESAADEVSRKSTAELYRNALRLRPRHAAARLGFARVLLELNDLTGALEEIDKAQDLRRNYAEASAVEGRILRMAADEDAAIEAFRRAINEAKGFQPEAHTGLALVFQDKGQYDEATAEFRIAISQLSETEPILYQLLGSIYEKQKKYKEAVEVYEKYLELAPDGNLAPAIRSVMDQLRRQAEGRGGLPY